MGWGLRQVYVEDARFVSALCQAALAHNRTEQPLPVHITVSTGAVRSQSTALLIDGFTDRHVARTSAWQVPRIIA